MIERVVGDNRVARVRLGVLVEITGGAGPEVSQAGADIGRLITDWHAMRVGAAPLGGCSQAEADAVCEMLAELAVRNHEGATTLDDLLDELRELRELVREAASSGKLNIVGRSICASCGGRVGSDGNCSGCNDPQIPF